MPAPKEKLTPQQKEDKKIRDQFNYIVNRTKGAWSFGHIKTNRDLADFFEWPPAKGASEFWLSHPLDFKAVKDFIEDRRIEMETYIFLKNNPPLLIPESEEEIKCVTLEVVTNKELIPTPEEDESINVDLPPCARDKSFLYWFQKKATLAILQAQQIARKRAYYLIAATGLGKTFIVGAYLARLVESKWIEGKSYTPWPYIYVTKANVVEQTQRVLKKYFGLTEEDVLVIGIDQLRSEFGKRFVRQEITVEDGIESLNWKWRNNIHPLVVIWDEAHSLKNAGSQQSQIAQSYNNIEDENIFQVFVSATPYVRVSEAKCFCVASRIPYTFGLNRNAPMVNDHWNDFARNIASDYGRLKIGPTDYSPGAMTRLMNYMNDYIHRVKGVKTQFKAYNKIKILQFETDRGREEYTLAWEKFMEEKAKIEGSDAMTAAQANFNILAQLQVFLKAAESNYDRVNHISKDMDRAVKEGFAAACAVRFKLTICKCVEILITKFNVPRDKISLIWGGAPTLTKKQKIKRSIINSTAFMERMAAEGLSFDDLDLDDIDADADLPKYPDSWRLGPQNRKQRQLEIDRFQRGESLYCFYTFRAGGVGLSLHHTDEMTKEKVRHKPSGYAYVEDIPLIPTRPRFLKCTPTWSAQESVQGLGRCARINSLSDTNQELEYYAGTVEERQARVMSVKLHCLSKAVRNKESWEDIIIGRKNMREEEVEALIIKGERREGDAEDTDAEISNTYIPEDDNEEEDEENEE